MDRISVVALIAKGYETWSETMSLRHPEVSVEWRDVQSHMDSLAPAIKRSRRALYSMKRSLQREPDERDILDYFSLEENQLPPGNIDFDSLLLSTTAKRYLSTFYPSVSLSSMIAQGSIMDMGVSYTQEMHDNVCIETGDFSHSLEDVKALLKKDKWLHLDGLGKKVVSLLKENRGNKEQVRFLLKQEYPEDPVPISILGIVFRLMSTR